MIIVGLTGAIGHGKTTLAEFLAQHARQHQHWESSDVIIEVANALRHEQFEHPAPHNIAGINSWLASLSDIISACVHCPADFTQFALTEERLKAEPASYAKLFQYLHLMQDKPELQNAEITPLNKTQFRSLLQWLGGYLVKTVDAGIWYNELIRRIHLQATKGVELVTVGGVRFPGDAERIRNAGGFIVSIERPRQATIDAEDVTERERSLIQPDVVVVNDGNLSDLRAIADRLYRDLETRNLQAQYQATTSV